MSAIEPSRGSPSAAPRRRRRGEVADQVQARLGVGGDPAGDHVDGGGRADHDARSRRRSGGARGSAARRAATKLPSRAPIPTTIALGGESGPTGLSASRPSRTSVPSDAGRDQRGQLVEGAVADPAVVVVVEAVELDARGSRPGLKSTAQKSVATSVVEVAAVATQSAAISASQSPAASRRRSSAPRRREPLGPRQARAAPPRRSAARRRRRRPRPASARRGAASCAFAVISASSAAFASFAQAVLERGSARGASSRSACAAASSPASCSTLRAQVVELPVAVLAVDRLRRALDRRSA